MVRRFRLKGMSWMVWVEITVSWASRVWRVMVMVCSSWIRKGWLNTLVGASTAVEGVLVMLNPLLFGGQVGVGLKLLLPAE